MAFKLQVIVVSVGHVKHKMFTHTFYSHFYYKILSLPFLKYIREEGESSWSPLTFFEKETFLLKEEQQRIKKRRFW